MRPILLLTALIFAELSFSQNSSDTTIEKRQLDSIEYVVYKLKDSLRRLQYEYHVLANCRSIDTTGNDKDSIIFRYRSESGNLLKVHTKKNLELDSLYVYEKIEYLNSMERPEFVEHWELARSSNNETGNVFGWKVYSYERFVYDSAERIITSIMFYPAFSRRRVRKYEYTYHVDGTSTSIQTSIEIERFWN